VNDIPFLIIQILTNYYITLLLNIFFNSISRGLSNRLYIHAAPPWNLTCTDPISQLHPLEPIFGRPVESTPV
jgi:hypothetical protein